MNEADPGREPVELLEIVTPKCVNTHGSAPCTATEEGNAKCFNTTNTCNDIDNYQERPADNLTPDLVLAQDDTGSHTFGSATEFLVEVELNIPLDPDGVVFEIGGDISGLYLGFTSGSLVARIGDGSVSSGNDTARIEIDPEQYLGGTYTLYVQAFEGSGAPSTVTLYLYDPVELELYELGSAETVNNNVALFDADDYGVGTVGDTVPVGESETDYNGEITLARLYDEQSLTLFPDAGAYHQKYYFDDGRKAKPLDDIYILPLLTGMSAVGTKLNLTGNDDRYEPLGRRATLTASFGDAPHSGYPYDPYRSDRTTPGETISTFWPKWMVRNKFNRTRALVRRYTGYRGQALSDMKRQTYVLDSIGWQTGSVSLSARDFLSLTEFRRAQVPEASPGLLANDIDATQLEIKFFGDQTDEYPASGTLRIDDELMTYSGGLTYTSEDDRTTLTLTARGTDGSTAEEHDQEETVQLCRRYTNQGIVSVVEDLLINDAKVPGQVINRAKLASEVEAYLNVYELETVISEPTGVARLIGEIAEQCSFYVWWDERSQKVEFQAIRSLLAVDQNLTETADIIGDTFQLVERPKERLTSIAFYYSPRDFAGDLSKPSNYKRQLIVANSTAQQLVRYGKLPQSREIFSRWLNVEAQVNQTAARVSVRYADIPRYATFMLDAKDRVRWVGDYVTIEHRGLIKDDGFGTLDTEARWLIVEAEEVEAGHMQKIVCVDITLDGEIYLITEDGIGTYTAELFAENNAFITDNDGLNSDGTRGATIS